VLQYLGKKNLMSDTNIYRCKGCSGFGTMYICFVLLPIDLVKYTVSIPCWSICTHI